jgi:phosphoribosylformylglycinamidine synthase
MAFSGDLGMEIDLAAVPVGEAMIRNDSLLFSESNSRFLVEVHPDRDEEFRRAVEDVPHARVGRVTEKGRFLVRGARGESVVDLEIDALRQAWQAPFRW